MAAPILEITGTPVTLDRCSPFVAYAVAGYSGKSKRPGVTTAIGAALIRECWPEGVAWPYRPVPRPWEPAEEDLIKRGRAIFDALHAVVPMLDKERNQVASAFNKATEAGDEQEAARLMEAMRALPVRDLPTACRVALAWSDDALVSARELQQARDLSEPPKGG
ncbi:hypothetical protein H8E07_13485 [bacterium]|nr:hypothetical protein [bacterium]